jgi:protein SCO1/2/putative membrane protein
VTHPRPSYRLGASIVLATLLASAAICLATVGDRPSGPPPRAAHFLAGHPLELPPFALTERSGHSIGSDQTAGRVWIAAFIFTRCPSSCPRISAVMKGLQRKLAGTGVQLASISVDPWHDTPEVLRSYAQGLGADPDRWWFLTGPKSDIHQLVLEGFRVPLRESTEADRAAGAEDVAHSARLALVDHGNRVVGYFDSESSDEVAALVRESTRLDNAWGHQLPTLNALLNAAAALALVFGWFQIRSGRVRAHVAGMITALLLSTLFLAGYLAYHFLVVRGSVPFQGTGKPIRFVYFTILLSHTLLAVALVPLVALTLTRAAGRRFDRHARIAALTWPIWLYVSVTGVIVYWMLYRLDFSNSASLTAIQATVLSPGPCPRLLQ